ncbi:MAG: hypothetical protein V2A79_06175 [Planctomycetota bacterium]
MPWYWTISCPDRRCGLFVSLLDTTDFYVDAEGEEHPVVDAGRRSGLWPHATGSYTVERPVVDTGDGSGADARREAAGHWTNLVCWSCGHLDHESVPLFKESSDRLLAIVLSPPPSPRDFPRPCPACGEALCDSSMVGMFLRYRDDPERLRNDVAARLACLKRKCVNGSTDAEPDILMLAAFAPELYETREEAAKRMGAELLDLANIHTPEELILYRLDLRPELPVDEDAVAVLRMKLVSETAACRSLYWAGLAKATEAKRSTRPAGDFGRRVDDHTDGKVPSGMEGLHAWFRNPLMKAKLALDAKVEECRRLRAHLWIAERFLWDPEGTFDMFHARCPRCRSVPLDQAEWHASFDTIR